MNTQEYIITDMVRDYECDVQGIVNNAVYMNYCEHARNQYIKALGFSLYSLHQQGETPVVVRAELDFKRSLQGGERYEICTQISSQGTMRLIFNQKIYKVIPDSSADKILIVQAMFTVAILNERERPLPIVKTIFKNSSHNQTA